MTTSHGSILDPPAPVQTRGSLRLLLGEHPGTDKLDGGWWPRSRDLTVELADLIDHFPAEFGRVVRALFSPPDWDSAPRQIAVKGRSVKIGSFPHDDTHLIHLTTSDGSMLHVLVVPPGFSPDQGAEALLASATPGNSHSAQDLLDTVTEHDDIDPRDHWSDDGGPSWEPRVTTPTPRARR